MRRIVSIAPPTFSLLLLLCPPLAEAANFADYSPATVGDYATYKNVADSTENYTQSIMEEFLFAGQPAVKVGIDANNYQIVYNDGSEVMLYAVVEDGVLYDFPDITLGEISDGMFFNLAEPTNYTLIRLWDNLDPTSKSAYAIDSSRANLILWVTYDSNFPKNSQNSIVESNLSSSIPNYAVTHLEWLAPGIGTIVNIDVDAASGMILDRFELTDFRISPNPRLLANGSGGPLSVNAGDSLSLELRLFSGSHAGTKSDWWFGYTTASGAWFHYDLSGNWMPGIGTSYQNGLFDLGTYSVDIPPLSTGAYTFYFGIDTEMNGEVDMGAGLLYYDNLEVNVR